MIHDLRREQEEQIKAGASDKWQKSIEEFIMFFVKVSLRLRSVTPNANRNSLMKTSMELKHDEVMSSETTKSADKIGDGETESQNLVDGKPLSILQKKIE